MKKRFLILFFTLFLCTQVFAQFNGGSTDGFDVEARLNTTLDNITLVILYQGSNGDGHDIEALLNTTLSNISLTVLYEGGNGDGHDIESLLNTTLDNISLTVLYEGGNGDGHDIEGLRNTTLDNISLAVLYEGGNGDGHDIESLLNTTLDNISLAVLYEGGNGDGHDIESLLNTTLDNMSLTILYNGGNADGFSSLQETVLLDPNQIVDLALNIKALLQGATINPSVNGLMNDVLRTGGLIPTSTPYSDLATINASVLNDGGMSGEGDISDNIVDWVWIEIRSATDNTFIVDDTSALIQRDGDVVGLDGLSNVTLEGFTDNYFVVIKHRNHLAVMTSNALPLTTAPTSVDFTNVATPTFGDSAQIIINTGNTALWAGDTFDFGQIKSSGSNNDTNAIKDYVLADPSNGFNSVTFPSTGYLTEDVDLNGVAKFSGSANDSNLIKDNVIAHPLNGFGSPTYTIMSTVPPGN